MISADIAQASEIPAASSLPPGEPETLVEAQPYSAIARFYDQLMAHVDYGHWARFATELLIRHGITSGSTNRKRLLEAGCGTGTLAISLAKLDLEIDAFDRSAEMVGEARRKATDSENAPHFFVGTFENFQASPPYDAVICLYDSINYLLESEQIIEFLNRIKGVLRPGGVFLFDICTELNSILHFNGRKESDAGPGYKYRRTMRYKHANRIQENIFEIEFEGPPVKRIVEHHRQKIFSLDEIREFISDAGFVLEEELDGYERKRPTSRSLRVHFLVRRPLN